MAPSKNTTPAVPDDGPQDVEQYQMAPELAQWYYDTFPADLASPEMIQSQIVDSILSSDPDSVLDPTETLDSGQKWSWKKIVLHEVESVMSSSYEKGMGIWVKIGIVDAESGEKHSIAIGSPTLLAQLKVLAENDRLPAEVMICPIRKSKEGRNPPLYFRRWDYNPNAAR